MNAGIINSIRCATQKIVDAIKGSTILDELKLEARLVTNIGTKCASVKDGDPELVTVLAWHTDQGDHLKSTFMNDKLEHFTEADVKLLDDCDCECKEC